MRAINAGHIQDLNVAVRPHLAYHREGHVMQVLGERLAGDTPGIPLASGIDRPGRQIAKGAQPPLPDDAVRRLHYRSEHTAHGASFNSNGAEREREVALFRVAM